MASDLLKLWFWPLEAAQLGVHWAETLVASQNVIAARLPVIGAALADPLRADHRELSRMVTEKGRAFGRSGRTANAAFETLRRSSHANARDMGRFSGGDMLWPADWLRIFERNLAAGMALAALPGEALAPVHKRATANARRLKAPARR